MSNEPKPKLFLAWSDFGDAEQYSELLWPSTNADGSLHFVPEDGANIIAVQAKSVELNYLTFSSTISMDEFFGEFNSHKPAQRWPDPELLITDARIIVHATDPKYPRKRLTGHLWYPWISSVHYRPKQSFLFDSTLRFVFEQNFPPTGTGHWHELVDIEFDKRFDPTEIAREIVRRVARHDLAHPTPPPGQAELEALLRADPQPMPEKGSFAEYEFPAYVRIPGGVPFVRSNREVDWEWERLVTDQQSPVTEQPATASASPAQAPANWYDDGSGRLRYWDGTAWTDFYADEYPSG